MSLVRLICAVDIFVQPWKQAAKAVKKNRGKEPRMTVFSNVIRDMGDGCVIEWTYGHIWQILTTKRLIALMDGEGVAILMDRNGFTVGSYEEFVGFMRQNCPHLKFTKG